ncbi:MAG: baseplate assembly protein [Citromicrobium sp.]|nr:baseplate assembly protein [Citromicrobium sp.]
MKRLARTRSSEQPDEAPVDPAAIVRFGTIASVDLSTGEVEVDCGEVRTAPIPFSTGRAGATRIWSPPTVGEQVLLLCPGGDIEAAVAMGAIPQDAFPIPGDGPVEMIVFADGARISYDPENHVLEASLPDGATALVEASGGLTIRGDVTIEGRVAVEGALDVAEAASFAQTLAVQGALSAGSIVSGGIDLSTHIHAGVSPGTGISGAPQ